MSSCAFKVTSDTYKLLLTEGRYEQQRLPEDFCVQPALLIHSNFARQTFNFPSIHQMSLQFSRQRVSCHNAEDLAA